MEDILKRSAGHRFEVSRSRSTATPGSAPTTAIRTTLVRPLSLLLEIDLSRMLHHCFNALYFEMF